MITKNDHTSNLIVGNEHHLIQLFIEFTQLKQLYRQGWLKRDLPRQYCESVADHSFQVALLSYVIADEYRKDLDLLKVIKLALIHEAGEIEAGDMTPSDGISAEEKSSREYAAVKRLFSGMPNPDKYISLWREFEDKVTPEAIFVNQIDKLESGLQARIYTRQGFGNLDEFFPYVKKAVTLPEFSPLLEDIIR